MKRFKKIFFTVSAVYIICILCLVAVSLLYPQITVKGKNEVTVPMEEAAANLTNKVMQEMAADPTRDVIEETVANPTNEVIEETAAPAETEDTIETDPMTFEEEPETTENFDEPSESEAVIYENTYETETPVDLYAPVFLSFTANPQTKLGEEFNIHKFEFLIFNFQFSTFSFSSVGRSYSLLTGYRLARSPIASGYGWQYSLSCLRHNTR